jgi:hypothetical protein
MRTHIAKALQKRSKTIQQAVKTYNAAAMALNPPKPTIDWTQVSHYKFLEEFPLLRHSSLDLSDKPWARPAVRETIKQWHRICRAREEITRCNIEVQRLHTSIADEGKFFDTVLSQSSERGPILGAVQEFVLRRNRVNAVVWGMLLKIYALEGFTGNKAIGVRKGQSKRFMQMLGATQRTYHHILTADAAIIEDSLPTESTSDNSSDGQSDADSVVEGMVSLVDFIAELPVEK